MALIPCVVCRQPFYASCHDASCTEALCPLCEYAEEMDDPTIGGALPTLHGNPHDGPSSGAVTVPPAAGTPVARPPRAGRHV